MGMTMRVSLPGYDCLTDTNLDHYGLYTDSDYLLIKENTSGTVGINYADTGTINHSLGYVPMAIVWGEDVNGNLIISGARNAVSLSNEWLCQVTSSKVLITQGVGVGTKTCDYFVFYDRVV